jgi:hypothetical protein
MAYRATKPGILFGWCFVLASLVGIQFLRPQAAIGMSPIIALIGQMFLGPRQGKPLPELVEENPLLWRRIAVIWLTVAFSALYLAFFHRIAIGFLTDTLPGRLILFSVIFGPVVPSIYKHERGRCRNAPRD